MPIWQGKGCIWNLLYVSLLTDSHSACLPVSRRCLVNATGLSINQVITPLSFNSPHPLYAPMRALIKSFDSVLKPHSLTHFVSAYDYLLLLPVYHPYLLLSYIHSILYSCCIYSQSYPRLALKGIFNCIHKFESPLAHSPLELEAQTSTRPHASPHFIIIDYTNKQPKKCRILSRWRGIGTQACISIHTYQIMGTHITSRKISTRRHQLRGVKGMEVPRGLQKRISSATFVQSHSPER